jgi:hypothetical protein
MRKEEEDMKEAQDKEENKADDEVELLEGKIRRENLKIDLVAHSNGM